MTPKLSEGLDLAGVEIVVIFGVGDGLHCGELGDHHERALADLLEDVVDDDTAVSAEEHRE